MLTSPAACPTCGGGLYRREIVSESTLEIETDHAARVRLWALCRVRCTDCGGTGIALASDREGPTIEEWPHCDPREPITETPDACAGEIQR